MSIEPLSHATEVQDAHYQTSRGSDQVRGLVCHDRSKDAYFHVSILPQHQKFLRFAFGGEAYQYQVLQLGIALSPRTFTKWVLVLNYIDDWLILSQSEQVAVRY